METSMKAHATTHSENIARLSRIEGQIKGVKRMIEEGEYCIDIITQIQAARAALQSVNKTILAKHLKHCVAGALEEKNETAIEQKLEEIMTVIKRMEK
jgi:DNA-binding FrmR family transcriptional regulator